MRNMQYHFIFMHKVFSNKAFIFQHIAAVVKAFVLSGYKHLYPIVIEDCRLLTKPHFKFQFDIIIAMEVLLCKVSLHVN